LRERFWANGFELDQTVENPEPFLAPLPSLQAVSSEIELLQRSSSCFSGQFSDPLCGCKVRFGSVCICQNAYHFFRSVLQNSLSPVKPSRRYTGMDFDISFSFVNEQD
jgi:hypothetical protein